MLAAVDRETCIGCGMCAGSMPEVFAMDGDNIAVVLARPGAGDEEKAREAAENCPVGAIAIEE